MNLNDFNFFLLLVFLLTQPGEEKIRCDDWAGKKEGWDV